MDPAKLKVVELRAELAARGLDQKGVKAILVSRLQAALDQEKQNLTAAVSTDVDQSVEVQQQDPSIIENQFLPEQQFQVQTEPSLPLPDFPDTSPNFVETFSTNEPEYEAPVQYEAPIPEQQQQQQQEYYQEEAEAQFFNQNQIQQQQQQQQLQQEQQQQQQQKQYEEDDDDEEESESSRSENESNAEENNFDQNDDVSCEPAEQPQHQQFVDTEEPMESEQTDSLNEFANENISESNANHELNEATYEENPQTKLSELNEPMVAENPDDDDDDEKLSSKNGNEKDECETRKSPSHDKDKQSSTPDKESEKQENRKRKRSRSKSKSPPAKRANRRASPARNTDDFTNEEDEPEFDENAVLLSWYDSDLNLAINKPDLCSARPLSDGALALAWAGARSTYGVNKGKVCYEVQVNEINRVQNLSEERNLYELRCGWSILSDNLQLGESNLSFGYSGCAKKATDSVFNEYGIKYGSRGDVVGVYLDLDSTPCTIQYTVNGEPQGTAFEFNKEDLNGASLYPHILTKNLAFTVNFGQCSKLLVNEERPNRARRDESSRRDKDKDKRSKDSRKSSSPAADDKKKSTAKSESLKSEEKDEKDEEKEATGGETEPTDIDAELKEQAEENAGEQKEKVAASENGDSNDDAKNGEKDKPNEQKEYSLLPGYQLIGTIDNDDLVQGYQRPKTRNECEVILLIGLPGAGKTHWANQHSKDNVEKHYNILGVQNLLSKMTVCGESRKKHHSHGRWERFIDWATRGLHSIQDIAVKKRRNYILDQTNVLASAQRRKMKGYGDFKRIAAVIIPDDATHKERYDKITEKIVSENSLNEMKANFTLPSTDFGWFDEVLYTELNEEESKKKVQEFNEKGKKAVKERERDSDRGDRRRDDNRDRYGRDRRNWGQSSSDRRWRHQQGSSSQWHNRGIGGGSSSGGGGRSRDKWHGSSSSSSSSWGNRRYDYPNHRDRRHDDRRGGSRSDRDYKDNRDKRGGGADKHGSKREKDNHSSSRSSYSSKGSSSHWNSNKSYNRSQTMSSNSRDYGSYSSMSSSQQSSGSSNWASATSNYTPQQQQWLQWQQQGPLMQASQQHQSQQQHQQANNAQWWPQQQQQASGNHQGWQNWAQYAQAYGVNASNSNGANMGKK